MSFAEKYAENEETSPIEGKARNNSDSNSIVEIAAKSFEFEKKRESESAESESAFGG